MIVQSAPFATVVPPSVAGGRNQLVGTQLVQHVPALDAPESVFKGAERGTDYIALCIIVVLGTYLVV